MKEDLDILYKQVDGVDLYLDLFMPDDAENPPLILWIHGGAWMYGDRKSPGMRWQVERGYALASIEYRLVEDKPDGSVIFPQNIIDCKDALVFLKQNASKYGYDPARVIVAGDSADGHLASLMGASVGHAEWEREGADCSVQAVVEFYGPSSFADIKDSPEDIEHVTSYLLGAPVYSAVGRMRAAAANPVTYISGKEPPFLILHGDNDPLVPYAQAIYLRNALEEAGVAVGLHRVFGGDHGFDSASVNRAIDEFLDYYFK